MTQPPKKDDEEEVLPTEATPQALETEKLKSTPVKTPISRSGPFINNNTFR